MKAAFDILVPVASRDSEIAGLALDNLRRFRSAARIFAVTHSDVAIEMQRKNSHVIVLAEGEVLDGVTIDHLARYLVDRTGNPGRAGWYYQQFLKMAFARFPGVSPHYLIWDGDSVPFHDLPFFDDNGRILLGRLASHYHEPYFATMDALLGMRRCVDFSFIVEHMMVNTEHMCALLDRLAACGPAHWAMNIMAAIDATELAGAGFSEFELYGNFVAREWPTRYAVSDIPSTRLAGRKVGQTPSKLDLWDLAQSFAYASFESWDEPVVWKKAARKARSLARYAGASLRSGATAVVARATPTPLENLIL